MLAFAPAPQNLSEASKQNILSRAANLTDADIEMACENAFGAELTDIYDSNYGNPYVECREAILEAIEDLWADNSRNCLHMRDGVFGGNACWVAGGTNWGDSPHELDQLNLVNGTGLLDVFLDGECGDERRDARLGDPDE